MGYLPTRSSGRRLVAFCLVWLFAAMLFFPPALNAQTSLEMSFPGDKIEETEGRGLVVRSNPPGARVFIDGIERGSTPLRLSDLRAGTYFVRLEKEGYSERRFRVSVRPGSVVDVFLELNEAVGRVILRIQPAPDAPATLPLDTRISVDGRSYVSPALELPIGFRNIMVRAFGWEDVSISTFVEENVSSVLDLEMKPALFRLYGTGTNRPKFNPSNPGSLGSATLSFEVSGPGKGTLTVKDSEWNTVFTRSLGPFESWSQTAVWDGRDHDGKILEDGLYTLIVEVQSLPWDGSAPVNDGFVSELVIDSSKLIHPLTLSSGKSGLLYAPLPLLLPPRSFQIEGSLLAGNTPSSGEAWKSLPFAVAFRFSPIEQLELSAALNVIPYFDGDACAGVAGTVKWAFLKSAATGLPLSGAAGLTFSWTGKTGLTPFGMASGFELFFPFMVDLGTLFSFTLSPAVLWTGDEGFPWDPVPRLLVSGGFLMQLRYLSAGLSIRSEYKFPDAWPPYLTIGAEIKIFPPPSSFVLSIMGGVWIREHDVGGFGGIGIGMIY